VGLQNLHNTIKNVTFSPEGDRIAYFFKNDLERTLAVANNDGTSFTRIAYFETLPFDPDVVWSPDSTKIALFAQEQGSGVSDSDVLVYDFAIQSIIKLTDNGVSRGAVFSPDGSNLLYESRGSIFNYNLDQAEDTPYLDLEISADLDKMAWVDNENFVALSQTDGNLYIVNANGSKEELNYKKASMPSQVSQIMAGQGKIFIVSSEGIFEIELANNI